MKWIGEIVNNTTGYEWIKQNSDKIITVEILDRGRSHITNNMIYVIKIRDKLYYKSGEEVKNKRGVWNINAEDVKLWSDDKMMVYTV